MRLSFEVPDNWFEGSGGERLRRALGLGPDDPLPAAVEPIAVAGLAEYLEMLTGSGMPMRIDEARQRRLFHLIRHQYKDRIPSEAEVMRAFQLTGTQARALIRSVLARFRHDLGDTIRDMLSTPLKGAKGAEDGWMKTRIQAPWVADALNELLASAEGEYKRLRRVRGTSIWYLIDEDAFDVLLVQLGIQREE